MLRCDESARFMLSRSAMPSATERLNVIRCMDQTSREVAWRERCITLEEPPAHGLTVEGPFLSFREHSDLR